MVASSERNLSLPKLTTVGGAVALLGEANLLTSTVLSVLAVLLMMILGWFFPAEARRRALSVSLLGDKTFFLLKGDDGEMVRRRRCTGDTFAGDPAAAAESFPSVALHVMMDDRFIVG
jgi:hypothetical protein